MQQKVTSDLGTSEETESGEAKSGPFEADQIEIDESDNVANAFQSKDEEKKEESNYEEKSQAEEMIETGSPVQAEVSSTIQAEVGTESSDSQSVSAEETERVRELLSSSASSPKAVSETVCAPVSPEHGEKDKAVEVDQQANDSGIVSEEQRLSSEANVSVSADSLCELEKLKREMKMMETALQGAARQAQAKADEIAKMMNENEHLKAVIEDLKRKTNDAELETLREEYHQRVATLERKVYALTKERDTLRREQNKKSDAAALLKEKDEIINQVMAEGEELSKKQAAQEAQIRKLRAQIRELEEEKKGLVTKLQVEENKVESIKRDKTATEKLLQETIEKHQVELGEQKDYYTNALAAAKEAEELAEARANNEARAELESRLREAGERETMLVQALEELRQTLSRTEQQAVFREDMLRRDIEDLQRRYQASERRCEELVTQVPESTRPLLRQIEAIQETTARRAEAWAAVERSLNLRLQEAEAKAAAAEERERSVNERLSQTLSRINVLEAQISCLRAEQTQLTKSLEKERQRAAENRQEYLAAKEEADTQEGRANQLEEEIKELRRKHKQELQEALMHRELLQQEIEREKTARVDLERRASAQSAAVSEKTPIARQNSAFENGSLSRKLSSASSLGSMEESHFLQASLDSSDSLSDRKNTVEPTMSPYYVKSMTPSAFESILRQKEGELASYMSRLASMESIRDSLAEELVKMTAQCEKLRAEAAILPGIQAELDALRRRHSAALELMGERDEELEELRADIMDLKEMYREQVNLLVNKIQVMGSSMGNT
ncbi:Golgin candidate 5 [Citrus sinensis]|uniref:Golgin candidate 5 n=1 Tax=Citrus sinensis TaxID=2711 RepID=A0ACB8J9U8_CITSI|nr:Golgin candidate 5 [Citrus sinensis]